MFIKTPIYIFTRKTLFERDREIARRIHDALKRHYEMNHLAYERTATQPKAVYSNISVN